MTRFENGVAEQIAIPQGIIDFLRKKNGIVKPPTTPRYWVSEVAGCQRKSYYKQLGIAEEELLSDGTMEGMWHSVRGDFLHQLTYAYKWREFDIEYYIPLRNGRTAVLVGRLDMYDNRTKTIIDLKTTNSIKWQVERGFLPHPQHILQLQCYNTIFAQLLPIEELNLLYADMKIILAYRVEKRDLTDWLQRKVQDIENCVFEDKIPVGEVSGLCKYCTYQTRCCKDGNGLKEKPLSVPKAGNCSVQGV